MAFSMTASLLWMATPLMNAEDEKVNPLTLHLRRLLFHPVMHKRPEDVSIPASNKNSHENAQKSP
jgi:hypothetical protein